MTLFIDLFNFYPLKVSKLRQKNDSNEVTYVMSSGTHGTKNAKGDLILPKSVPKTAEEKHLIKLLAIVSDKINERFINLQQCFRFLDMNHSQSISINEFAQAIEQLRLKLSFDDIKLLFNYMDKSKSGEIGYDEFTLLLEERWRGIDPVAMKLQDNPQMQRSKDLYTLDVYGDSHYPQSRSKMEKLEALATTSKRLKSLPGSCEKITRTSPDRAFLQ